MLIDFCHCMEDAQLVLRFGPDFCDCFWIQRGAIGDDRFREKAVISQVSQESEHVLGVVGRNDCASHWIIGNGITCKQYDAVSKMNLVNTKRTGKFD